MGAKMKLLKRVLGVILAIILILLIVSFFLPEDVHVERTGYVNADVEIVFEHINDLRKWQEWSPWYEKDPDMHIEYFGPETGTDSGYEWRSEIVGNGKLTITESVPYQLVTAKLDFMEHGTGSSSFILEESGKGTNVTWTMDTNMGSNPIAKYFGLMMDTLLGRDYEEGLENLAKLLDGKRVPAPEPAENVTESEQES
jgi:hypothetical protein